MKINIKPASYLVTGSSMFKDRVALNESYANGIISERGPDGSRIEPLHPESLVIELAAALAAMDEAYCNAGSDMSREDRHAGRVALIKARALFARITDGSES